MFARGGPAIDPSRAHSPVYIIKRGDRICQRCNFKAGGRLFQCMRLCLSSGGDGALNR